MNCEQFEQRLQGLLDRRHDLHCDVPLQDHAKACEDCRDRMTIWLQIGSVLEEDLQGTPVQIVKDSLLCEHVGGAVTEPSRRHGIFPFIAAMAAVVLAMWTLHRTFENTTTLQTMVFNRPFAQAVPPDGGDFAPEPAGPARTSGLSNNRSDRLANAGLFDGSWRPVQWWSQVADDRWDALAGVDSVREGVAPIGRSVRRAMTILMTRTSPPSLPSTRPASESPGERLGEGSSEQTSDSSELSFGRRYV